MDEDLDGVGGVVVDVLDLDLALRVGGENRLDERDGRGAVGQLGDGDLVFAAGLHLGADFYFSAALAIVVVGEIGDAARWEIGNDAKAFSLEVVDRRAAEVVEIVREYLGRETDRDALGAVEEDDGELGRERDRLLGASIVAGLPVGGLRIEENLTGKRREAGLDVTGRGRIVTGEKITEIALRLDEVATLGDADERGADGGVAVRMEAHARAYDIGDLMKTSVVLLPKRVENAALDGLQAVVDVGDGAVENDVAGVFQEPLLVGMRERGIVVGLGRLGLGGDKSGRLGRRRLGRHGSRFGCSRLVPVQGKLRLVI